MTVTEITEDCRCHLGLTALICIMPNSYIYVQHIKLYEGRLWHPCVCGGGMRGDINY